MPLMAVWVTDLIPSSVTIQQMCVRRGGGVNIITDVLYDVNIHVFTFMFKAL